VNNKYIIRRAESAGDGQKLHDLFSEVFHPEEVGILAETMFHHLPGMKRNYWFIAEERTTGRIVSAFALIPWTWEMEGIKCQVAEMGIVGTLKEHRGQGLMKVLNREFDQTLEQEGFDLAVIQGIPGFYHQFGYSYAVPLENDINLPLHAIAPEEEDDVYTFRLAALEDIPYLMQDEASYRASTAVSSYRDEAHWRYLLTESQKTEYGSEFWIMEDVTKAERHYCRIPSQGFGEGLIVSEISETITFDALRSLFVFCKQLAVERKKPYVRLNLHNESVAGRAAIAMGAKEGTPYAWQIKIPDAARFLTTITPLLERRILASSFRHFSGVFKLSFYKTAIDLVWEDGRLDAVQPGSGKSQYTFSINADLFPALCLGHRTWQELRVNRPDISPNSAGSALFAETLFPAGRLWIHEQY
jgi:predicted N-acetyltransferase YhbS